MEIVNIGEIIFKIWKTMRFLKCFLKITLRFALVVLLFSVISCKEHDIRVIPDKIELAKVHYNQQAIFNFRLHNCGVDSVVVNNILSSVDYINLYNLPVKIGPGQKAIIKGVVKESGYEGKFKVKLTAIDNNSDKLIEFLLQGEREAEPISFEKKFVFTFGNLLCNKKQVSIGKVILDKIYRDTIEIYNPTSNNQHISALNASKSLDVKILDKTIAPNRCGKIEIIVSESNVANLGKFFKSILFKIEGENKPVIVTVEGDIFENFEKSKHLTDNRYPVLNIDEARFDFGKIKQGDKVKHSYKIQNNGRANLIIHKVQTTCGCTGVVIGKRILAPGKSGNIEIEFNSSGRRGTQQKSITLFCNDPKNSQYKLWIEGQVVQS